MVKCLAIVIVVAAVFSACNLKLSNTPHKNIKVYVIQKSKYQVRDELDKIISNTPGWEYGSSVQNTKLFNIRTETDSHSIMYALYFSGDDLEWLSEPDSVLMILAGIDRTLSSSENIFEKKRLSDSEIGRWTGLFDSIIVEKLYRSLDTARAYSINRIVTRERYPYKWQLCKNKADFMCDTLVVIREEGSYTLEQGRYFHNDSL